MKKTVLKIVGALLLSFLYYYIFLPPINPSSPSFWAFLFIVLLLFSFIYIDSKNDKIFVNHSGRLAGTVNITLNKGLKGFRLILGLGGIFVVLILINIICSPLFNSKKYANRIVIDSTKDFATDISEVNFNQLPLLDKISSQKLGDRTMGQASELVSQYDVSDLYTQINYNNEIIRVTPIEYSGFIKYLTNRKTGVEAYITVNSVDGKADLVKLEKGIRYLPSAYFFENLTRYVRFNYPTAILGDANFELDNDGNPYWIIQTLKYAGIGLREDVSGVIILNAVTGESERYSVSEVPSWVDHVYSAAQIINQIDDWGEYANGFFNSIFGQKDVVNTTDGYNYLVMNDDVYLYTGITSVNSDESNLGFVLSNLRTKETNYYLVPGAEEYSAMASAQGLVQEKGYVASFPLLINLNSRPTYLLSLKDQAGLVKMYAFVDVNDYQKVVTSDSSLGIEYAANKYLEDTKFNITENNIITKTLVVKSITSASIDGTTYYYLTDNDNQRYSVSIKINQDILPFIRVGDSINVECILADVSVITRISI